MGNQQESKAVAKGKQQLYFYRIQLLTEPEMKAKQSALAKLRAKHEEIEGLMVQVDATNYYLTSYSEQFKTKTNSLTVKALLRMLHGDS